MIVVDASALLEVLLRTPDAHGVEERLFNQRETLHAPHLIDVEIARVIRRYATKKEIDGKTGGAALDSLAMFPLHRYPHDLLLPRVWELRNNISAHDAVYVSLAEALGAPLLTRDRRLAATAGHRAKIELV